MIKEFANWKEKKQEKAFKKWQEKHKPKPPKDGPQVDDWVICNSHTSKLDPNNYDESEIKIYDKYMSNNMGKIVKAKLYSEWFFEIYFENFPEELSGFFNPVSWTKDFITFHSPNKEDCEAIIQANKYNI